MPENGKSTLETKGYFSERKDTWPKDKTHYDKDPYMVTIMPVGLLIKPNIFAFHNMVDPEVNLNRRF